jgi:sugar phosphate isomerase/epimerase
MPNDFSAEDLDAETQWLTLTCQAADQLGIPAVRIDVLPHREMSEDQLIDNCTRAITTALEQSESVHLGMENHGRVSNRPEFIEKLFGRVGDRRMGLTLDTGNFYWFGHPLEKVYQIMETYADRVYHTHVKNIAYPEELRGVQREVGYEYGRYVCPVPDGDVDHARVVSILREAGYDHDLALEDESLGRHPEEERPDVLRRDVEHLKSLV